jgi:hypothetical protein
VKHGTAALAFLLLGRVGWQAVLAHRGLIAASGDDFLRTLIAWDWAHSPFFLAWRYAELSWAWLPLPFWVSGSLLQVWMRPDCVPQLLSFVLSLLSLVLLWRLWGRLWNPSVAVPAIVCVATIPWHLWLGGAATAQPLFQCLVAAGLLLALSGNPAETMGAGLAFGLATAVRPEGWLLAALWLVWLGIGYHRNNAGVRVVSGALACLFPAVWIGTWWYEAGDPLLLVDAGARYQEIALGSAPSLLLRALQFPFVLLVTSPLLVLASLGALVRLRGTLLEPGLRTYSWLAVGSAATMFVATILGMGTTSAPQRYALLPLVLLVPFGVQIVKPGARRWVLAGVIAVLGLWGSWHVPRRYTFLWGLGSEIGSLMDAGVLPSETLVCGQEAWSDFVGARGDRRSPIPVCEEWGLAVASRHPGSVVCSRRGGFFDVRGQSSCRGISFRELPKALDTRPILLVTRNTSSPGTRHDLELLAVRGPYRVWGPSRLAASFRPQEGCPVGGRLAPHTFTAGVSLETVGWESGLLPPRVYLCWQLAGPTAWGTRPHLALEGADGVVTRLRLPRFGDGWPAGWSRTNACTVAELRVPEGQPAGVYRVGVGVGGSEPEVPLRSVVLGPSKRDVLLALLRGEASGWGTLVKTLLLL